MDLMEYMFQQMLKLISWIFLGIIKLIAWALGKVFTNVYAFITAVIFAVIIGSLYYCSESSDSENKTQTELVGKTTTYICTARKSLKVRTSPSTSASQMGSVMSGEEVEVYSISNGFAKIRYKGDIGYASSKYLKRK